MVQGVSKFGFLNFGTKCKLWCNVFGLCNFKLQLKVPKINRLCGRPKFFPVAH